MVRSLVVADIGNTTIDVGEFCSVDSRSNDLPTPERVIKLDALAFDGEALEDWLSNSHTGDWFVGSVNENVRRRFCAWAADRPGSQRLRTIGHSHLALSMAVRKRASVGIDRVAAAAATNKLRHPDRPAIIISTGSAITVNVVSKDGVFLGGLISPGFQMSLRSLAQDTDQLPRVEFVDQIPPLIGDDTESAIRAGTFWNIVTGIDGVLSRLKTELAGECDVFGTGGAMPLLLPHLHQVVRHEPNLVLSGLALANP